MSKNIDSNQSNKDPPASDNDNETPEPNPNPLPSESKTNLSSVSNQSNKDPPASENDNETPDQNPNSLPSESKTNRSSVSNLSNKDPPASENDNETPDQNPNSLPSESKTNRSSVSNQSNKDPPASENDNETPDQNPYFLSSESKTNRSNVSNQSNKDLSANDNDNEIPDPNRNRLSSQSKTNLSRYSNESLSSLERISSEELPTRRRVSFSATPSIANFSSFDSSSFDDTKEPCCSCCCRLWSRFKDCIWTIDRNLGETKNTTINSGSTVFIYIRTPLDGGYGWIVLICSTIILAIGAGLSTSLGILLNNIADDLKVDVTEIASVGSLQYGLVFGIAPVGGALANMIGFRKTSFLGASLCISGYLIASVTTRTVFHCLFLGIFAGCGIGICGTVCILIIGFYFEKYRAIAMGILTAGGGAGMFLISVLENYLINKYGWQITLRIHGMLYILVLFLSTFLKVVRLTKMAEIASNNDAMGSSNESFIIASIDNSLEMSTVQYPSPPMDTLSQISLEDILSAESLATKQQHKLKSLNDVRLSFWDKHCERCRCSKCCKKKPKPNSYVLDSKILDRLDILYTGSIGDLPEYKKINNKYKNVPFISQRDPEKRKSIVYTYAYTQGRKGKSTESQAATCWKDVQHFFAEMFDYETMKMSLFQVLFISAFLFACGFTTPFLFVMKRVNLNGATKNLIPAIGLTSIIFRLISGFASHMMPSVHPGYLIGVSLIITGIISIISADYGQDDLLFQYIYCSTFSWGIACWMTLRTVLIVRALGLNKLTNAFGLVSFAMGLGTFCGTGFCGYLIKLTEKYDAPFMFSGWSMLLSGTLLCYVPLIQRHTTIKLRPKKKRVRFSQTDALSAF